MISPADRILPLENTAAPTEQSAVADAVEDACRAGTPIYTIGGGTSLDYGGFPKRPGLGLSLAGLEQVVDYPARDLTITVEAGITVERLASLLAAEGQRLPVDIPQADRATIGGVVASSPSGPRRFRWGTMRDYVIGIRAVDGRGTAFCGGGRVVKNAAGLNLCRLLTGSLGTLGVITQVTLMVKPRPETSSFLVCDVADYNQAERLLAELVRTKTLPAAIELLAGPSWQGEPGLEGGNEAAVRLAVGFEGTEAEVRWMLGQLREEWGRQGIASIRCVEGADCDRLWSRLTEFPAESPVGSGGRLVVQISVLPSAMVGAIQQVLELDPRASIQAHAGSGVLRAEITLESRDLESVLQERLRSKISAGGGSLTVLSSPGGWRLDQKTVWGPPQDAGKVMQAIKDRYDPKGILNPGRFIF